MNKEKKVEMVAKILRFFGCYPRVVFDSTIKYGVCSDDDRVVKIGTRQSLNNQLLTVVHECIHVAWGLDHDSFGHGLGFYSWKGEKDMLTETIASVIFKKRMKWRKK
jgi:hypothetical protein